MRHLEQTNSTHFLTSGSHSVLPLEDLHPRLLRGCHPKRWKSPHLCTEGSSATPRGREDEGRRGRTLAAVETDCGSDSHVASSV